MPKGRIALLGALGAVATIEGVGVFTDSDTISGLTADMFHIDTPAGKLAFGVAWLGFAGWFLWHILRFVHSVKAQGSNTKESK